MTYLGDFKCLDIAGMSNVWATAQINQGATSINSGLGLLDLLVQNAYFELIVGKHLQQLLLGQFQSLKWLFFIAN